MATPEDRISFTQVRARELEREAKWKAGDPRHRGRTDRVGLCLSGGGIRSAAFCLGVIQALHDRNIFNRIDYLSTVSGGGYIGTSLMAARLRAEMDRPAGDDPEARPQSTASAPTFPFDVSGGGDSSPDTSVVNLSPGNIADSVAVRALRDHSRYLIPNGSFDILLATGQIIRGVVVNVLLLAPFLLAPAAFALAVLPAPEGREALNWGGPFLWTGIAALLYAALFGIGWGVYASRTGAEHPRWENRSRWAKWAAWCLLPLAGLATVEAFLWIVRAIAAPEAAAAHAGTASGSPTLAWLSAALGAATVTLGFVWQKLGGMIQRAIGDPTRKALVQAITARGVAVLLALALPALLVLAVLLLIEFGRSDAVPKELPLPAPVQVVPVWAIPVLLAALAFWRVASLLRPKPDGSRLIAAIPLIVAALLLLTTTVGGSNPPMALYAGLAVLASLIAGPMMVNATSLHRLYRDRLEEGFSLGWRAPDATDDAIRPITLRDLADFYDGKKNDRTPPPRPYLIANMTVNLSGSRQENKRGREGDFFMVTADHVGSDTTGYATAESYTAGETPFSPAERLDLGSVAAISGAAVASRMGRLGLGLFAPTLAFLNIRLGFWLRNPRHPAGAGKGAGSQAGLTLLDEATGALSEEKPLVYLSDGGHIDNLGLYQLLKRRCDIIIAVDGEADPGMTCAALTDVERFARIDLGVRLDIRPDTLRAGVLARRARLTGRRPEDPAPTADPSCHAVIGRIRYPAQTGTDETAKAREKSGILLYIKAAMTGDEPNYVLDYERRYPSFPHETTGDQFFSEEQFEAYRALGFHAARDALRQDCGNPAHAALLDQMLARLGTTRTWGDGAPEKPG